MEVGTLVDLARRGPSKKYFLSILLLFFSLWFSTSPTEGQRVYPGRGAISAQDIAKLSASAAGSDTADQVCARFAAGSAITAPPELKSQNGVLEVTFKFLTVTDTQGLARYC